MAGQGCYVVVVVVGVNGTIVERSKTLSDARRCPLSAAARALRLSDRMLRKK
jgi:hypothetical protein